MLHDIMARLEGLYERTGMDWNIEIHHCLTEPTCPTVTINPDGLHASRYRVDADTIEEGIAHAVALVHREIIQDQTNELICPITSPDDAKLSGWIEKWRRGERVM